MTTEPNAHAETSRSHGGAQGFRHPTCNTRGRAECSNAADFRVTAEGYPCPMFPGVCSDHLGAVLVGDAAVAGSTRRWLVEAL